MAVIPERPVRRARHTLLRLNVAGREHGHNGIHRFLRELAGMAGRPRRARLDRMEALFAELFLPQGNCSHGESEVAGRSSYPMTFGKHGNIPADLWHTRIVCVHTPILSRGVHKLL